MGEKIREHLEGIKSLSITLIPETEQTQVVGFSCMRL